jgi:hypothetical protein
MQAAVLSTVPCPACGGGGQRPGCEKRHGRKQICLACRGTGQVETDRVCLVCHHFVDLCVCPRERGRVRQLEDTPLTGKGYYYNKQLEQFVVDIVRFGRHWYIASRKDETEAVQIAQEALKAETEDELWSLKAKYSKKHQNGNGTRPAPEEHIAALDEADSGYALEDEAGPRQDMERSIDAATYEKDGIEPLIADAPPDGDPDAEIVQLLRAALAAQHVMETSWADYQARQTESRQAWEAYEAAIRSIRQPEGVENP